MTHNEGHEELLALHALGSLGSGDAELLQHLEEGCQVCERMLTDLRESAAVLAFSVPSRRPRPEMRAKVIAALGPPPASVAPIVPRRTPWWLLAAAAAVLLFFIVDHTRLADQRDRLQGELAGARTRLAEAERGAANRAQTSAGAADLSARLRVAEAELARRDLRVRVLESDDVRMLFLGGQDPQPGARAKVFWSETAKRGVIVAANLQPLSPDQQYQLWVFDQGKPVDAGVFDVDPAGRVLFESNDLAGISGAQNFAVTVEPRGGRPQPTGPIVLLGTPAA